MGRLFGTDGARGVAITELTCELAMNIGRAAAIVLTKHKSAGRKAKILIGKDTRISSDILEAALVSQLYGVTVELYPALGYELLSLSAGTNSAVGYHFLYSYLFHCNPILKGRKISRFFLLFSQTDLFCLRTCYYQRLYPRRHIEELS